MKQFDFKKERDENGQEKVVIANQSKRRLDLFPRLICLLIAVIIWMYCVNINEDDVVTTFTVKPVIVGVENMADGLSIYNNTDIPDVVITVQGTNRDINKYSASDYTVYIDVSTVDSTGWNTVKINAKAPEGSSLSILSQDKDVMNVYADRSTSVVIPITYTEKDFTKKPAYNYSYGFEEDIESITITGPKTIVENIERAEYVLTGDYNSSQTISGITLEFYKKNFGTDEDPREKSSWIKYDPINFNIDITTTAPMFFNLVNTDHNFYYSLDVSSTNIIGDPEVLKALSGYSIDMTDYSVAGIYKLNINEMITLPEGVSLESENVVITLTVTEADSSASSPAQ